MDVLNPINPSKIRGRGWEVALTVRCPGPAGGGGPRLRRHITVYITNIFAFMDKFTKEIYNYTINNEHTQEIKMTH